MMARPAGFGHMARPTDGGADMIEATNQAVTLAEAYDAAHGRAILVDRSDLGMLKLSGATRLDLINRMSTQKVDLLKSGEGAATVLTSDIGRIIDRLILYVAGDSVYALTGEANGANIARYLMRFVFYNDDFQVEDLSATTAIFGVYGRMAADRLGALFGEAADLARHHWRQVALDERPVYVHRTDAVAGDGYFVMANASDGPAIWAQLAGAGLVPAGAEAFEYLRIESGLPRFGRELTLDYIPLEANLWADVSFNKGCYTGQEIIARMESRGRLAKQLVRLRPDAPLTAGAELSAAGRVVGSVTSAGVGPAGPLALGYVKTAALQEEAPLTSGPITVKVART
jgi:aminomethyltransferase